MTSRRRFLELLALGTGAILVPKFGRWHRQGSGLLVPLGGGQLVAGPLYFEGNWKVAPFKYDPHYWESAEFNPWGAAHG